MKIAIVVTKLPQFEQLDFRGRNNTPRSKTTLDVRNFYNLRRCVDYGLNYIGIGRTSELYS